MLTSEYVVVNFSINRTLKLNIIIFINIYFGNMGKEIFFYLFYLLITYFLRGSYIL